MDGTEEKFQLQRLKMLGKRSIFGAIYSMFNSEIRSYLASL